MKTVNSLSGGKTSSYIAANYPADHNLFALVRIEHEASKFPDKKIRQLVEDRIQAPFIATAEDDMIIYTMLDLEQYIGREITWVTGRTFDEVISKEKRIPSLAQRFCTNMLKIVPMQNWWYQNFTEPIESRIGFRANETKRAERTLASVNERGFVPAKLVVGKHENGNNKWKEFDWQVPKFPLIEDNIYKDQIEGFWKDKPVRFAPINNCVGCFHQNPILLRKRFDWHPNKMDWFIEKEREAESFKPRHNGERSIYTMWKSSQLYEEIKNHKLQLDLFETDFNECDSGYCGI